jgi:chromate reductase, NAD(P)H dehydrogenase (quinone)
LATIVGISGSLRRKSFNTAILDAAAQLVPEGTRIVVHSIRGISLYDGDVEASEGIPAQVVALKDAIAACDGLLIATPEYNNSIPGVLKNAIDWLTRPDADIKRVFGGLPVAMMGASPGGFGTTLSQNAWLPVWRTLGALLYTERRMLVSRAHTLMDAEGKLIDAKTRDQIAGFVQGFAAFTERTRR